MATLWCGRWEILPNLSHKVYLAGVHIFLHTNFLLYTGRAGSFCLPRLGLGFLWSENILAKKDTESKPAGKVNNKQNSAAVYTLVVFVGTFFCACLMTLISSLVLEEMESFIVGFVLLLLVILVGVLFDIVGTAVSVCDQRHLNAKASRRIPGAKKALMLTKNASRVANICNDVVGDICGTVSGGIGTALAAVLVASGGMVGLMCSVGISGCIAAMTVAGKALGKNMALENADTIIFNVGRLLDLPAVIRYSLKNRD